MVGLDISEVARQSGLPASTLRYYERRGLIRSIGRSGQRRVFDDEIMRRLALISLGRSAGFALDEIGDMFGPDGEPRIDRDALVAKADELDERIGRLTAMRDGLRHTAACPASSHLECRTFQSLIAVAASRRPDRSDLDGPRSARIAK